jgi:hypothetical protein
MTYLQGKATTAPSAPNWTLAFIGRRFAIGRTGTFRGRSFGDQILQRNRRLELIARYDADVSDHPIADNRVVDIECIGISDFVLEYGKRRLD